MKTKLESNLVILVVWVILPLSMIFLNIYFDLPVYDYMLMKILGVILFIIGFFVAYKVIMMHMKTGRITPVGVEAPIKFIAKGLYKYTRNPMYVSFFAIFLSAFFILGHFLLLVYFISSIVFIQFLLITKEEPELKAKFGKEYVEYSKKVPRWFIK